MQDIFIDPKKKSVQVKVESRSLHAVGVNVTVFASDGSTILEQKTGNTQQANPLLIPLEIKPDKLKSCYVRITSAIASPDGKDNKYLVICTLCEDDADLSPTIPLTGETSSGTAISIGTFRTQ